jgi:hypothetical protein
VDFFEFRQSKVWLKVAFGPEPSPDDDPRYQPMRFEARVAYCPGKLNDDDIIYLAHFERLRLMDFGDDDEALGQAVAQVENRAQKRAREKAQKRADATPPGKDTRPTLIDYLKRLVVDWDATGGVDADGMPIPLPITDEVFGMMELGLRLEIVAAIMADVMTRPNLTSLSSLSSAGTKASGPIGQESASRPSSTVVASSPGTTSGTPNGLATLSGGGG